LSSASTWARCALANPLSKEQHPLRLKASSNDLKGVFLIDNLEGSYGAQFQLLAHPLLAG